MKHFKVKFLFNNKTGQITMNTYYLEFIPLAYFLKLDLVLVWILFVPIILYYINKQYHCI